MSYWDDVYCECVPDTPSEWDCICGGYQLTDGVGRSFSNLVESLFEKGEIAAHPNDDEWTAIQVAGIAGVPAESISLDEITLRRMMYSSDAEMIEAWAISIT